MRRPGRASGEHHRPVADFTRLTSRANLLAIGNPNDSDREHTRSAPVSFLMPVTIDAFAALEIIVKGRAHRFEWNENGAWYNQSHRHKTASTMGVHRHEAAADAVSRILEALTTFSHTRVERTVAKLPLEYNVFGTANPEMVVVIFEIAKVQPALSLHIGHKTPDGFARYVAVVQRGAVVTIPDYQIALLMDLVASFADPK